MGLARNFQGNSLELLLAGGVATTGSLEETAASVCEWTVDAAKHQNRSMTVLLEQLVSVTSLPPKTQIVLWIHPYEVPAFPSAFLVR